MKHNKDLPDFRRVLFEPVAPYFADAYNTLTSVVQGLALGVLGYEITKLFFENNSPTLNFGILDGMAVPKLVLVLMLICLLWHRYIVHCQFYAWSLGVVDTAIPVAFGLLEVMLILVLQKAVLYSSFLFACVSTCAICAYCNSINRHHDPKVLLVYQNHFASEGSKFADALYLEVAAFEKRARLEMTIASAIMWLLTYLIYYNVLSDLVANVTFFCVSSLILLRFLFIDLWKHLNSSERLKPYWVQFEQRTREVVKDLNTVA